VVSPILTGESGLEQLRKVCKTMNELGVKVNKKCGFHVHVGARRQPISFFKNLMRLYARFESAIDTMMAPSRRSSANLYCAPLSNREFELSSASTIENIARACRFDPGPHNVRSAGRYKKVNLQSYWQHGTVEFRHHQGTVDHVKTEMWVRLCLRMAQFCAANQEAVVTALTVSSLADLLTLVGAEKDLVEYAIGRAFHFAALEATREANRATRRAA
jgi:hypothetical protein